jgi:DNA invertase Pin-like site-specific DNA recombinase
MVNPGMRSGRAAMYVRMSTEHQQYSLENQAAVIQKYADQRNLVIVKKFVDSGKSGLTLSGRIGLHELLVEAESHTADFQVILVYDVSRWGRFQDTDESAYYEYVCKRAGVQVHYCAEQFQNDGSISSALLKTIKRAMAGEYSRELSVKTFAGQSRLVEMGYRQGGTAGFGLRRQLLGRDGSAKQILEIGERKSLQTERVILVPGPEEEVSIVREIFTLFTADNKSEKEIAETLNEREIKTDMGRAWSRRGVQLLLTNPKYIGSNVFNRESVKFDINRVRNPSHMWIRRDAAFTAIVPLEHFMKAQEIIHARPGYLSDQRLLELLKHLWQKVGRLSETVIDTAVDMPSSDTFRRRFKTLRNAYSLIGYTPARSYEYKAINQLLKGRHKELCEQFMADLSAHGATVEEARPTGVLRINREVTVRIVLCRCRETRQGRDCRWLIRPGPSPRCDLIIAIRLQPGNEAVRDYYVFPDTQAMQTDILLRKVNRCDIDVYRFDTLEFLLSCLGRSSVKNAVGKSGVSGSTPHARIPGAGDPLRSKLSVAHLSKKQNDDCTPFRTRKPSTTRAAAKTYQERTQVIRALIRRSGVLQERLAFMADALQQLLVDEHFLTLLRAEGLDLIPDCLAKQARR